MEPLAILLLLAGVIRHLSWEYFNEPALIWNATGALVISLLLGLIWNQNKGKVIGLVILWFLYEEMLVAVCSTWRIFDWWSAMDSEEMCSSRIGFKLGSFSLVLLGALIVKVASRDNSKS